MDQTFTFKDNMETLPIFNLNFYKFTCEDALTDQVLELAKKSKWLKNGSNEISADDLFFHPELHDWFDKCILSVKEKIGLPNAVDLPITSCWVNKAVKLNGHLDHAHPNSVISGVFYLSSHQSGATVFSAPNYWLKDPLHFQWANPLPESYQTKILPVKSTLILFPSHLWHSVLGLKENETRYTVSFNTYLSGEIDDDRHRTRLYLKSKSVRDWHNEK